jgi:hypothetical protein
MIGFNALGKMGRLGNQMFQYAALRGISANAKTDFCFPNYTEGIRVSTDVNLLKTELFDAFKMQSVQPHNIKLLKINNKPAPVIQEKASARSPRFDEKLFKTCPDNTSIRGYFQAEKYFKNVENIIRKDFQFHDPVIESCDKIIKSLDKPIALHVRRTDYFNKVVALGFLGEQYYQEALKHFDKSRQIVIFSDDPEWCKQFSLFNKPEFLISERSRNIDLCLMSMCNDFIIANSSFSWWGAWLANRGKVIAPQNWNGAHKPLQGMVYPPWYGEASRANLDKKNTQDLFSPHWTRISL